MVSGKAAGYLGVFLGTTLIIFDQTQAGLGLMVVGIVAFAVLSISDQNNQQPPEGRR